MRKRCLRLLEVSVILLYVLSCLHLPAYTSPRPPVPVDTASVTGDEEEKELLESLKISATDYGRKQALELLYRYYKKKEIRYLTLSYLLKLVDVQKRTADNAGLETSYRDLGGMHESKRDYLSALNAYFEALVYSRKLENDSSGYIYLRISEVFRAINRMELAWKYIKRALDYTIRHKDEALKVFVLTGYSALYYEEEDYENALKFIDLGLRTESRLQKYLCTIQCLHRKALILMKMAEDDGISQNNRGKYLDEAMTLLKSAVDIGLEKKKYDRLLPVMGEYIEILIDAHRLAEAAGYLDKIDDIYAPYYPYFFLYYYLEAMLYEKQDRMDMALRFYDETAKRLEEFVSKQQIHLYDAFKKNTDRIYSRIVEFYLDLYSRTSRQLYLKKALYFSEIKNVYIYELGVLENKRYMRLTEEKKKLENEFLQYNKKYIRLLEQNREQPERYEKKLEALKKQNEELTELILETPIFYKKYRFSDLDLDKIRSRLKKNQQIIKFAVLNRHIYTFSIDRRSVTYRKLAGSANEILAKVRRLTEPLDDFTHGHVDYLHINYDLNLAHQLYNALLKDQLEHRASEDKVELFIIPDNELFKLPFEALVTGFNQQEWDEQVTFSEYGAADYLVRQHPISYALSLFHFQKRSRFPGRKRYTISAFGDPRVNNGNGETTRGNRLFQPLPSSRKEILSIRTIFGEERSRIFLADRFTGKQFETYAPRSEILHIATHFLNNIYHPQYSALLFSSRKNGSPYYYAHEIFKLKLDTRLVVLSACESSEKHFLGMQGLRGMTASFRHAGVRSMIVSMWPVDQHSAELTPLFYRQYGEYKEHKESKKSRRSLSPARSLRAAKLAMMKKTAELENGLKISYAHPFLWANYILYTFSF
jgi:CHAT domain-containing protein